MCCIVRRWLRRQRPLPPLTGLETEQVAALEQQVNAQLTELIAYLDRLSNGRDEPPEVPAT